ncbi:MAG: hypothetical protein RL150_305 [Candidatus Parcubacteria bacterium]|jgi:hypothetical protein
MKSGEHFYGETGNAAERAHFGSTDPVATRSSIERLLTDTKQSLERAGRAADYRANVIPNLLDGIQPYTDFPKSLAIARRLQQPGSNPEQPSAAYAQALRSRVEQIVRAMNPHVTRVAFYTACSPVEINGVHIRLNADQYHSTDAFLDIFDNDPKRPNLDFPERRATITIDGTINPHKADDQNSKANIVTLFPQNLDPQIDIRSFQEFVHGEATKVAEHYESITGKRKRSGTA